MNRLEIVRNNYSAENKLIAKNFAIIAGETVRTEIIYSNIREQLEAVYKLEVSGKIREAANLLVFQWRGFGTEINTENLSDEESADLRLRVGSVLSALANLDQIEGGQEEARNHLSRAQDDYLRLNLPNKSAMAGSKLGLSYWRSGEYSNARIILENALISAVDNETKCHVSGNLALVERTCENYEKAIPLYEYVLTADNISELIKANAKNDLAIIYKNIAAAEGSEDFFSKSIELFLECLEYYDKNNKKFAASTRNNIGRLYQSLGDHKSAQFYFRQAKTILYSENDKIHLAITFHSLAVSHLCLGNAKRAIINSVNALDRLSNEKTAKRAEFSLTYAVALARDSQDGLAKKWFDEVAEIAEYLSDSTIKAKAELFHLRELFDTFDKSSRFEIYKNAVSLLCDIQDKEVIETLEEIKSKLDKPVKAEDLVVETDTFNLEAETLRFRREIIERALKATNGVKLQAAKLLQITRGKLDYEIKKNYPSMADLGNKPGRPEIVKLDGTINILSEYPAEELRITFLKDDFAGTKKGDALFIHLGQCGDCSAILIESLSGIKAGYLRYFKGEYYFELITEERFHLSEAALAKIIGEVIGYCPAAEYKDYLKIGNKDSILPLIEI